MAKRTDQEVEQVVMGRVLQRFEELVNRSRDERYVGAPVADIPAGSAALLVHMTIDEYKKEVS